MAPGKLSTLSFVDLYLCLEGGQGAHYRGSMRGLAKHPDISLGPEYKHDLDHLADYIRKNITDENTMVVYDGMRLRAAFIKSSNGQKWAALRKVKDKPPKLDALGFPPPLVPHLQKIG